MENYNGRNNKEKNVKVFSDIEEAKIMKHLTHCCSDGKVIIFHGY